MTGVAFLLFILFTLPSDAFHVALFPVPRDATPRARCLSPATPRVTMQAEPDSSSSEPVHVPPVLSLQDYHETYEYSVRDPGGFWGGIAESFHWDSPWDQPVVSANFKASSLIERGMRWCLGEELAVAR